MRMQKGQLAGWRFHAGELAVQERAGVRADAERLTGMLAPAKLRGGIVAFLADRTFAVITAQDAAGSLWSSPLIGKPGFLTVTSPTTLRVHTTMAHGDPLDAAPAGQPVGLVVMEFAARRRVRINDILTSVDDHGLTVEVEQAYGNCPQYIQQRTLTPDYQHPTGAGTATLRRGTLRRRCHPDQRGGHVLPRHDAPGPGK